MKDDNIFRGCTRKELKAIKEVLRNFYYGKDLKNKVVRKFYTSLFKQMKKDLKEALKYTVYE